MESLSLLTNKNIKKHAPFVAAEEDLDVVIEKDSLNGRVLNYSK
jgi:hypothetical protein